jgi:hypothetical protein
MIKEKEAFYVSPKPCPVCGEHPHRKEQSLGKPGGRGYPGYFSYEYVCECCKLLKGGETSDLYVSKEDAIRSATELWNEEVDRVQKCIEWGQGSKE